LGFDFAGGTNFKPAEDMHMHGLRIRFEGKDAIDPTATLNACKPAPTGP